MSTILAVTVIGIAGDCLVALVYLGYCGLTNKRIN